MARRQTIAYVIAEEQFEGGSARFVNLTGLAFHHHAGSRFRAAGGDELSVDLNQANETRVQRAALLQITECRNIYSQLARSVEDTLSRREFDRMAVNLNSDLRLATHFASHFVHHVIFHWFDSLTLTPDL